MLSITNGEETTFQFRITENFTARALVTKISCRYFDMSRETDFSWVHVAGSGSWASTSIGGHVPGSARIVLLQANDRPNITTRRSLWN